MSFDLLSSLQHRTIEIGTLTNWFRGAVVAIFYHDEDGQSGRGDGDDADGDDCQHDASGGGSGAELPDGVGGWGALQRRDDGGAATVGDARPVLPQRRGLLHRGAHFRERGGQRLRDQQRLPELRRRGERSQPGAGAVQRAERGAGRLQSRRHLRRALLPHLRLPNP